MATATDENNNVNNTICYDDVNRLTINEVDSFDVDIFINTIVFDKINCINTINFNIIIVLKFDSNDLKRDLATYDMNFF